MLNECKRCIVVQEAADADCFESLVDMLRSAEIEYAFNGNPIPAEIEGFPVPEIRSLWSNYKRAMQRMNETLRATHTHIPA